jgi:hypothetical protein
MEVDITNLERDEKDRNVIYITATFKVPEEYSMPRSINQSDIEKYERRMAIHKKRIIKAEKAIKDISLGFAILSQDYERAAVLV